MAIKMLEKLEHLYQKRLLHGKPCHLQLLPSNAQNILNISGIKPYSYTKLEIGNLANFIMLFPFFSILSVRDHTLN